jgi:hypothetical protein
MFLQVAADIGKIVPHRNAEPLKRFAGANARAQQQCRRGDGAGTQDHFPARRDLRNFTALRNFDAGNPAVRAGQTLRECTRDEVQIGATSEFMRRLTILGFTAGIVEYNEYPLPNFDKYFWSFLPPARPAKPSHQQVRQIGLSVTQAGKAPRRPPLNQAAILDARDSPHGHPMPVWVDAMWRMIWLERFLRLRMMLKTFAVQGLDRHHAGGENDAAPLFIGVRGTCARHIILAEQNVPAAPTGCAE